MSDKLLVMEGIDKSFPGVRALDNCRLDLNAGEVLALVGENGAGKSTLMKILTGVYTKDAGRIIYKGKEVDISSTKVAQGLGISIIHQELNLAPHLTAAQNIFIGREFMGAGKMFVDDKVANKKAQEIFGRMNLDLDPKVKVDTLTVAKQQMVEIAKALSFDSSILIMDEPTAALTDAEIEELFKIIKDLQAKGVAIVYISHRMEELKKISDRITIMRDGCYVNTVSTKDVSLDEIISMMVGRTIYHDPRGSSKNSKGEVVLEVKNLNRGKTIKDVSFKLHKGEILGFAGLMGAGRTEVARAIFGADKVEGGKILIKGKEVKIYQPKDAVEHGIGYLSEDRKRYGLTVGETVEENVSLASVDRFTKYGFTNFKTITKLTNDYISKLAIKTPSSRQTVKNLSGGNQQKVVIAKWLLRDCDVLIFDEPTRGIDIGAKSEIYNLLSELVQEGKSIIMISSELPEILRMSDRVIVMCEGRVTGELAIEDANQETIMKCATNREN
ncbi:MAG: sugar ABC transporter ATP-binding protein [Candidatus Niameybacter stercoravium]|nr:sugar ABC transporter ATP-binding protein [Candidatus Niameybacter stercoravium]